MTTTDAAHMAAALGLARRGLGLVWPNPSVGCVLVQNGRVVGRGRTANGGRPHAETEALRMAGAAAAGATAYVTLEPCSHHGQTGPCAEALIRAGVARVVVAQTDPDPRVSGRGLALLQGAGIAVTLGVGGEDAAVVNAGFISRVTRGRPWTTVKVATTLDGRIATAKGESQWITGSAARQAGHLLRANHDAILVGSGTAIVDNPRLTCRLPGLEERSPVRVVVDGHLRLPLTSALVEGARRVPTWLLTGPDNEFHRLSAYANAGVDVIVLPRGADGKLDLQQGLAELGRRGLTRLLIESGARLLAALLRADVVDSLAWFRAASLIGGDGLPVTAPFGVGALSAAPKFIRQSGAVYGTDSYDLWIRESHDPCLPA